MQTETVQINGFRIDIYTYNTVIVGSGAAGLNAADRLFEYGQTDIALVTENINAGTSRNTGSDKQTYYKLTLSGYSTDSVKEMARTLFEGGCMDGDIALCEAASSAQCFYRLVELGIPFPKNRYGEYIGYKTDHDTRSRATSAGPYTSKKMTECLEKLVRSKNIPVHDRMQCIKLITEGGKSYGLMCIRTDTADPDKRYVIFNCKNIIYAVGGPAGIYSDVSYPAGHYGSSGIAYEAGVKGNNLTEWQYGLASLRPRWNVSGTYMQAIPRIISTDAEGNDEKEFLSEYIPDTGRLMSLIFMKGYQWPFDIRKVIDGSSIVDILVYNETYIKGRRVFLDYRQNPGNKPIDFTRLSAEAAEYLQNAGADCLTPVERLKHMNMPAYEFYKDRGIDLADRPLEIALCAQHSNGGLSVNAWWETNIEGFFAVGEVSGTHGIYRPGGTALNSGQVGSMRAAQYIAEKRTEDPVTTDEFLTAGLDKIKEAIRLGENSLSEKSTVDAIYKRAAKRMSLYGGAIRNKDMISRVAEEVRRELDSFADMVKVDIITDIKKVHRLYDTLLCQYVYLSAMLDYIGHGARSRGSALYTVEDGILPFNTLPDMFRFKLDDGSRNGLIQEVILNGRQCTFNWRQVRKLQEEDYFFENVWRIYRENKSVY